MVTDKQLPDTYNVELVRGDDYTFDVQVEENGSAVDFTGHTNGLMELRKSSGELVIDYASSGALTMGSGGRVTVQFQALDTKTWPDLVQYEFQSEDPNGEIQTYIAGTIVVQDEVNKQ